MLGGICWPCHCEQHVFYCSVPIEISWLHFCCQAASAIGAVTMDDMLDDVIVEPVLQEMTEEVAMDTLKYYGNKLKRKETKEVLESKCKSKWMRFKESIANHNFRMSLSELRKHLGHAIRTLWRPTSCLSAITKPSSMDANLGCMRFCKILRL